jgi:hypothetical protein
MALTVQNKTMIVPLMRHDYGPWERVLERLMPPQLGSTTSKNMPYANQSTDQEGGKGTLMAYITSMGAITRS